MHSKVEQVATVDRPLLFYKLKYHVCRCVSVHLELLNLKCILLLWKYLWWPSLKLTLYWSLCKPHLHSAVILSIELFSTIGLIYYFCISYAAKSNTFKSIFKDRIHLPFLFPCCRITSEFYRISWHRLRVLILARYVHHIDVLILLII